MKLDALHTSRRYWITGIAVALIGILVARVIAPHFEGRPSVVLTAIGRLLGFGGLIIISIGVSRRVKDTNEPEAPK
jgi:hypothetical protein